MSLHMFEPEIAARVGVNAAILYQNIVFWCEKNRANGHNEHDGNFWTYNSLKAWGELFPYMTTKQIRTALDVLEENGLILSGNFNVSAYDRTKWFCPVGPIHLPCRANPLAPEGEPIPDNKPDNKPDINTDARTALVLRAEEPRKPAFEDFWKAYPKKAGKAAARKAWDKAVRKHDPGDIIAAAERYGGSDGVLRGFVKHPQGWLNDERFLDADLMPGATPRGTPHAQTERRAFDSAIVGLARQIADGTVRFDDSSRNPFGDAAR
jgi:hypothetical protein